MDLSFIVPVFVIGMIVFLGREWNRQSADYRKEQTRQRQLEVLAAPVHERRAEELHQAKLREVSIREVDMVFRRETSALDRADRELDRQARKSEADRAFDYRKTSDEQTGALQRIAAVSRLALDQRTAVISDLKIKQQGGTVPSLNVPADLVAPTLVVEEALPSPEAIELEQDVFDIVVDGQAIVLTYVPALKMGRYTGAVNRDFFECSREQLAQDAMAHAMSL